MSYCDELWKALRSVYISGRIYSSDSANAKGYLEAILLLTPFPQHKHTRNVQLHSREHPKRFTMNRAAEKKKDFLSKPSTARKIILFNRCTDDVFSVWTRAARISHFEFSLCQQLPDTKSWQTRTWLREQTGPRRSTVHFKRDAKQWTAQTEGRRERRCNWCVPTWGEKIGNEDCAFEYYHSFGRTRKLLHDDQNEREQKK